MSRKAIRSPLCSLLSGLMLAACGGVPEEAGLAPSEESLGTQETALDCAGASVNMLTIDGVISWGGVVSGGGNWSVSYPSNGVKLSFYVDGLWRGEQVVQGDANRSGTWSFNDSPITCGSHTFEVRASPAVFDSSSTVPGVCAAGATSQTRTFSQTCPTAALSCSRTSTSRVTCTGSGSGGTGGFTPSWQKSGQSAYDSTEWVLSSWEVGAWQQSFLCPQTTDTFSDRLRIEFKVRDSSGMDSSVRSTFLYCKAGVTVPY